MGFIISFSNSCKKDNNILTDIDGNVFQSVIIGTQEWMVQNLKTTRFNDGIDIPLVTDNTAWSNLSSSGYCWYNNDETANKEDYGALYNYYAVKSGKLCPAGWHVAADSDWTALLTYFGDYHVADLMKETGTLHWLSGTTSATNESGFTALPGGSRLADGTFSLLGEEGIWWSDSESAANFWYIYYNNNLLTPNSTSYKSGFSVRCVKN